jgi:hypothetical protein
LFPITTRVGFNCFFVEGQVPAAAHDDAALDDHGLYVARFGGVNQIRLDVVVRRLIQIVEIDDQIGSLPFLDEPISFSRCSARALLYGRMT